MNSSFGEKNLVFVIIVLFFGMIIVPSVIAENSVFNRTIYVDDDGGADHTSIQDAINAAEDKDTIFVYNGIYCENIFIDKTIQLLGEKRETTFIDGNKVGDVIYIDESADGVLISGFTIQNAGNISSGGEIDAGIELHSNYNIISNNIVTDHRSGIFFWISKNNNITNNIIQNCDRAGIDFLSGINNTIIYNIVRNNLDWGICVFADGNCYNNHIIKNHIYNNDKGLTIYHSNNFVHMNNFYDNGISAQSSFNLYKFSPSRNTWNANYWDDWRGFGPKWIQGFLSFNFDWNPVKEPYDFDGGIYEVSYS